jgi:hypothetical protein
MTTWYPPATPQDYYPSAGTGGFLLVALPVEVVLVNLPFSMRCKYGTEPV